MWNVLKKLLPKCKTVGIQCLEINGQQICDFNEISNHFNLFFVNIGKELASKIANCTKSAIGFLSKHTPAVEKKFVLKPVKSDVILKMLLGLSDDKAIGLDGYQSKLLKVCAHSNLEV